MLPTPGFWTSGLQHCGCSIPARCGNCCCSPRELGHSPDPSPVLSSFFLCFFAVCLSHENASSVRAGPCLSCLWLRSPCLAHRHFFNGVTVLFLKETHSFKSECKGMFILIDYGSLSSKCPAPHRAGMCPPSRPSSGLDSLNLCNICPQEGKHGISLLFQLSFPRLLGKGPSFHRCICYWHFACELIIHNLCPFSYWYVW